MADIIFEILKDEALPQALRAHSDTLKQLADAYKAINAPTGPLGIGTLTDFSTEALAGSPAVYANFKTGSSKSPIGGMRLADK